MMVYVSSHGNKFHSESDCSGMKNYSTMTLTEARKVTSDYCDNCAEHLVSVE